MSELTLEKYHIVNNNGIVLVYRHGELWQDYTGNKFMLALLNHIEILEQQIKELKNE